MPRGSDELLPAPLPAPLSPMGAGAGSFGAPIDEEEGGKIDIRRYIGAVLRHKWMIGGLGLVGLAAGLGLSKMVKPVYEAQATIQVAGSPRNQSQGPIQTARLFEARGWIEISRSFTVLDEVVRRRKLYLQTDEAVESDLFSTFMLGESFTPGEYVVTASSNGSSLTLSRPDGETVEVAAAGDSLGRAVGFQWVPGTLRSGASAAFRVVPPRDAAVNLQREVNTIPPPPDGSLLRLQMRGTNPRAIAATLNTLAGRFVEVATQLKREDLNKRTEVLRAQLARSQGELTSADNALEGYRIQTITEPSDRGATPIPGGLASTRDPVFDAFFELRLSREALENDRSAILRALAMSGDSADGLVTALGTVPSVRAAPELTGAITELGVRRAEARRMSIQFTSNHPPLRQLEEEIEVLERDVVRAQARALADNISQRIADLDGRIAASSRQMQQIPPRVAEEARRRRAYEIAQEMNATLTSAYEQARLAELSAAPDVGILDSAVPPSTPVTDQIFMIIAGGLFGGLGLGIGLALLLDRFDHRIRHPDQVTRELGLQILGAVPLVRSDKSGKPEPESAGHLIEALRSVRMNLGYAHGSAGTFITTITSPGAGEGKSFLSANLAKSYAESGHRTLLIDGDTRRGALHRTLGGFRKPGLLDFLSGGATLEQVVQHIPDKKIDFIACGTRRAGGPELLASSAMAQMLMGLRTRYSAIIVDSPPLGAGVDPLVLASLCGSLVLVLRNGVSDRDLAESKLGDLQRLPIRMLGAVLNDVKPEGVYRYYSYLPGYRADDEIEEAEVTPTSTSRRKSLLGRGT